MTITRNCINLFILVATNCFVVSKASGGGLFRPTGTRLAQFDYDFSLSHRIGGPTGKARVLQANKTSTCIDFEATVTQLILEKIKNPTEMQTLLCRSESKDTLDDALFNVDEFFNDDKYDIYADCAKSFFIESVVNTNTSTALMTDTDACRKEVATTIAVFNNSTATGARRHRELIIFLVAFGFFAAGVFTLLPVALGFAIPAVEKAIIRSRRACTSSSQCPKFRCCALNLRRDRVCLPTPAIRNVRERKCLN